MKLFIAVVTCLLFLSACKPNEVAVVKPVKGQWIEHRAIAYDLSAVRI